MIAPFSSLAPPGASGLKFPNGARLDERERPSRPARGEWIEISFSRSSLRPRGVSRPARGEWIEILQRDQGQRRKARLAPPGASGLKCGRNLSACPLCCPSRPTRGEWIEIFSCFRFFSESCHPVDRNSHNHESKSNRKTDCCGFCALFLQHCSVFGIKRRRATRGNSDTRRTLAWTGTVALCTLSRQQQPMCPM